MISVDTLTIAGIVVALLAAGTIVMTCVAKGCSKRCDRRP